MVKPASVDEYMARVPDRARAVLEDMRHATRAAAPGAAETISYNMPTLKDHGRFLVSYAAFKDHCSLFPASDRVVEALGEEIAPYLRGRGTIRFALDVPLPKALGARVVEIRLAELAAERGE